ncbi:type II toxin-antitoxin system HicB family antitoxin [Rhodopseudomonas sp. BAL398]|uniref:type II toxin-antitoxin system HicB family antitoxin n=1 Tax=Rhodopseudomonas sp. BAL398 TaxID=3034676 RepID=UPI0023E331C3|nr:type II toxin-antitoxin system HicB family antitoxin [Rhodopseudomonas sp. BAL398]MDF3813893.1 type II toxin-antitoxin system HicB family antitoxin [Rhodopseudomonas sp. BAL398]WOK18339.1 type II toxin-antitoxin system HicB family antitoxin [Rhodopseudomonas sp. BAL398]
MPDYIALIHKDDEGCFTVSFPDIPGLVTAGDSIEDAIEEAEDALGFAAEGGPDGAEPLAAPRSLEQLNDDPQFVETAKDAIVVVIELAADAIH